MKRFLSPLLLLTVSILACARGGPAPVPVRVGAQSCAWCAMTLSDAHLSAQLLVPNQDPLFFDDIACLRDYLAGHPDLDAGSAAFVTDHRTGEWIPASKAFYSKVAGFSTPKGSELMAHEDVTSFGQDQRTAGGVSLTAEQVFGSSLPPSGSR